MAGEALAYLSSLAEWGRGTVSVVETRVLPGAAANYYAATFPREEDARVYGSTVRFIHLLPVVGADRRVVLVFQEEADRLVPAYAAGPEASLGHGYPRNLR